jgi:hypothetical protein
LALGSGGGLRLSLRLRGATVSRCGAGSRQQTEIRCRWAARVQVGGGMVRAGAGRRKDWCAC